MNYRAVLKMALVGGLIIFFRGSACAKDVQQESFIASVNTASEEARFALRQ